ncbi:hypothetical protein ETB97_008974 [Aspergillus alliaceus]|uniref:Uncharacterized protein n=1 Tax=Petromyces alliaceus TaxID=209559 RepID=A0A8H5ZWG0_PETAA|nr:hypothetical protein ETB97_008974 [Aspergillus burnettii]
MRTTTGNWSLHTEFEEWIGNITLRYYFNKFGVRPMQMLLTPICFLVALHASFIFGVFYATLAAFPILFEETRGWDQITGSLAFLALLVGILLGAIVVALNQQYYNHIYSTSQCMPSPEARLPSMMLGSVVFTGGLFLLGWTANPQLPWIASFIGAAHHLELLMEHQSVKFGSRKPEHPEHRSTRNSTKSALVGLIHDKTMKSPSIAYDNGEVTTLMSTGADSLDGIAEMVHETWAQVIEVLIAATTSVLSAMKDVKMLGLQHKLTHRIQQLRECELWASSKLRWIMVYYNASANALGIFSPAITLVMFAVISVARGGNLDTETAFTTMAILSMVTHPANMIMTIMPRAVAAFSGFERIQAFLLRQSLHAHRGTLPKGTMNSLPWNATTGDLTNPSTAIQIRQLRIGRKRLVLEHIDIEVAAGSITIIYGPTGSGKSTLLRAILGEVVPVQGSISLSTRQISYCAQKTWLPNGTIKEIIYGPSDLYSTRDRENEIWFHEVTNLCCLTHDLNSLPHGDRTRIGSGRLNLSGGQRQRVALARALFARCDILLLDDAFSALDGETEQAIFDNLFGVTGIIRRLRTTVVLVSNSSQYFQAADHVVVLGDHRIIDQGNWQNIKVKAASVAKFSSSYDTKVSNAVLSAKFDELSAQLRANAETEIDLARQTGDPALYGYYLSFIDFENIFFLIISTLLYAFFITIPQYWLRLWTELDGRNTAFYVSGFLILSTLSWISTSAQMWSILIRLAPQSGLRLHQRLLHIVMSAPLSYFSKTDNGSILNRFSQDVQLIDKQLPSALQAFLTQIFKLLMQIVLLCMAEKWLTMSLPACMLLVCVVQKVYLRTSRQLRFLELESRAGVFLNFLECVEGLETIRSFGWSRTAVQGNIRSVDNSQRPEFLLLCLQRWLNLVLDLLGAAVATSVVALAVAFRGHVSGGQVGIALNIMLVTNSTLLKLVENWTMLETSMGAISRLKTLEETTAVEGGRGWNPKTPENWPSRGHIEFKDITVSYPSGAIALRNLSLNVTAGQKLVVCGRTGSTLLLSLLRLLELQSGKIELDGVDIRRVRLDYLRRRCFVAVSQDPLLLLNETLRFNLDPDASISDDALVVALNKVGLWFHCFEGHTKLGGEPATVINVPGSGEHPILDEKVSNFQELSVGQRQLFALCRALVKVSSLRHSGVKPVVVLDEVTSSLDPVTECTIHCIIDEEFTKKGHTVIIVAHKLGVLEEHTKTGRDALALMADGQLQEVIEDLGPVVFQRFRQLE